MPTRASSSKPTSHQSAHRAANDERRRATNETKIAKTSAAASQKIPATTNAPSFAAEISIGSIVITNAAIRFSDRSIKPNVNLTIEQANGTIAGISSEELQHADVNLHALVDNVGPADITGTSIRSAARRPTSIKISVKDVDLTPTSPYAGKFAGYGIAEGKLNLDLTYEIVGKKLEIQKCHHARPVHVRRKSGQPRRHASARAAGRRDFERPRRQNCFGRAD
jgi:hypothetical protein